MMGSQLISNQRPAVVGFFSVILLVGFSRLALSLAGVPDRVTTFFSMSVVILLGVVYFGATCSQWRDRLLAAYVLSVPYTLIAVSALAYTWFTSHPTIFQRHEHSMTGLTVGPHLIAMLVGGFTFEPWLAFAIMSLIGWVVFRKPRI